MTEKSIAVVLFCNKPYLNIFFNTCNQLITNGKYKGDICLIIGNDLNNSEIRKHPFIINNKIIIIFFPDIQFSGDFLKVREIAIKTTPRKWPIFVFHKLHTFNVFFKKWDYILYLDCGMHIYSDIQPILSLKEKNTFIANRDGIDGEEWDENFGRDLQNLIGDGTGQAMKLHTQFLKLEPYYSNLKKEYNLYENCPQSGLFLFDTDLIDNNTFNEFIDLAHKYPILRTPDQSLIGLYFTQIKKSWKQFKRKIGNTYTYDMVRCVREPYIMVKYPSTTCELDRGYFAKYTGQKRD